MVLVFSPDLCLDLSGSLTPKLRHSVKRQKKVHDDRIGFSAFADQTSNTPKHTHFKVLAKISRGKRWSRGQRKR
jgi:hypothetical protein